jgi:signal transduction histidine kinase
LLKLTSPILAELHDKHNITHLYFHYTNQVNFLRVHKPEKHGDFINRFTMHNAQSSGQASSGIELGPLGTFTLRVVRPWHINNRLVGYIELGKEIEHVVKKLKSTLDVDLYISIYKKFLKRKKWEEGMQMLGRENKWDQLVGAVIISQTLKHVPEIFRNFLTRGEHEYMHMAADLELTVEGRLYRVGVIPLFDAGDREVGDIVVMYDVTEHVSNARSSVLAISFICVAIGMALFIFFFIILNGVEKELGKRRQYLQKLVKERTYELTAANENLLQEVAERRRVENELKEYHDHLEVLVKKRTTDLEETQSSLLSLLNDVNKTKEELKKANSQLKELDNLKSMFIASMSHELRTPLNSIIGFTGVILQGMAGEINDEQKDQLQRVYSSAKHLLALISDIIDISKIEAGKIQPYTEEFQLDEIIKESISSLQTQIDDKGLVLETSLPQSLKLKTDRRRLLQCILNYLTNAVKFTEKGRISIAANEIDGMAKIMVKDTGIGVKKEDIPKLFNSFVRLDSSLKTTIPGTGLGLYLTK